MNSKAMLATITIFFLALISWQLRWVILILFSAILISIALDVLIQKLQSKIKLARPLALTLVLLLLIILGAFVFQLLVPELITQTRELVTLLPTLLDKLTSILSSQESLLGLQQAITEDINWGQIQPLGSKLIGFAGGAANSLVQFLLILYADHQRPPSLQLHLLYILLNSPELRTRKQS